MIKKIIIGVLMSSLLLSGCKMQELSNPYNEELSLYEEYKSYYDLQYKGKGLVKIKDITNDAKEELIVLEAESLSVYTLDGNIKKIFEQQDSSSLYIYEENNQVFLINKLSKDNYDYEIFKLDKEGNKDITKRVLSQESSEEKVKESFNNLIKNARSIKTILEENNPSLAFDK